MSDRKKAIETLKENLCAMCAYGSQNMESCDIRSCDNRDAIKALDQEPTTKNDLAVECKAEDYINKRELIQKGMMGCDANGKMLFFIDAKELDSLPSVTVNESEDCISRSQAIKEFCKQTCETPNCRFRDKGVVHASCDEVDVLKRLPSITPKNDNSVVKDIKSEIQRFKDITSDSIEIHTIDYILSIFDKHISGKEQ